METKPTIKPNLSIVKPASLLASVDLQTVMSMQLEFFKKFNVKVSSAMKEVYISLVEEEHEEWIEEYYSMDAREYDELKELADLLYVTLGLSIQSNYKLAKATMFVVKDSYDYAITDLVSKIAEGKVTKELLSDLIYAIFSYADAMGWDLNEAYRRVHISNLSKLGDDGKPELREDGKILKSKNYKPPFLEDLTDGK